MNRFADIENPYKSAEEGKGRAYCSPTAKKCRPVRMFVIAIIAFGLVAVFIGAMKYRNYFQISTKGDNPGPRDDAEIILSDLTNRISEPINKREVSAGAVRDRNIEYARVAAEVREKNRLEALQFSNDVRARRQAALLSGSDTQSNREEAETDKYKLSKGKANDIAIPIEHESEAAVEDAAELEPPVEIAIEHESEAAAEEAAELEPPVEIAVEHESEAAAEEAAELEPPVEIAVEHESEAAAEDAAELEPPVEIAIEHEEAAELEPPVEIAVEHESEAAAEEAAELEPPVEIAIEHESEAAAEHIAKAHSSSSDTEPVTSLEVTFPTDSKLAVNPYAEHGADADHQLRKESESTACDGSIDPFKDQRVEYFEPPANAPEAEKTEWKNLVLAMLDEVSHFQRGEKELRDFESARVAELQIARFKMFCMYVTAA